MITSSTGRGYVLPLLLLILMAHIYPLFAQESNAESVLTGVADKLAARDYAAALALFDSLSPSDAEITEIMIMKASVLNMAGRPAEAKAIADRIVSGQPTNADALMILADAAALEGMDRERRSALDRVIQADPKNVRALTDLGNISIGSRNLRLAANYFDQALAVDADNGEAMIGRATVYRYVQEPRNAEQLLNRAIRLYPQWARPLHERARLYKGAGFEGYALDDLDKAKALEPENYWIAIDRGTTLLDLNRKQDALEEFNRAISLDRNIFLAYVYSAGIKNEAGDYSGAERDFAELARLRPDYYFAFEGLGMIKMKNRQWAEARDAFLEAYRQAPREYTYALLAAVNWMRAGRQADPRQFLAQVLRTAPRDTLEYTMLRLFHDLSGDLEAAVQADGEINVEMKARMLFYLASYYDIRGNRTLADRYYLMVSELGQFAGPEWQLNEWILEERGLKL
ncbi:MAG: tetratricopeptide repeat protein [Treponema sp.]|nr:tetratricopeptide repeat protein [Treponema sp.]